MRVVALDQIDLPVALPFLDLLFAGDSGFGAGVRFVPDETINIVTRSEAGNSLILVLPNALYEVRCHADIERAANPAREQIHGEQLFHYYQSHTQPSYQRRPVSTFPPHERLGRGFRPSSE